jgi:glycerol-3-phosphate dehydrogenase
MAADAVDNAAFIGKLNKEKCVTANTQIGDELEKKNRIQEILKNDASLAEKIHAKYSFTKAQIVYAVKFEMAICIEDILARRIRLLFLDAKLAIVLAPMVASIMAPYLEKDKNIDKCSSFSIVPREPNKERETISLSFMRFSKMNIFLYQVHNFPIQIFL